MLLSGKVRRVLRSTRIPADHLPPLLRQFPRQLTPSPALSPAISPASCSWPSLRHISLSAAPANPFHSHSTHMRSCPKLNPLPLIELGHIQRRHSISVTMGSCGTFSRTLPLPKVCSLMTVLFVIENEFVGTSVWNHF